MRAFAVAAMCAVAAVGCGDKREGGLIGKPKSETWTHKELRAHLDSKGLTHKVTQSAGTSIAGAPYVRMEFEGKGDAVAHLFETPAKARDYVGTVQGAAFSWGRFAFEGDKEAVDAVKKSLD